DATKKVPTAGQPSTPLIDAAYREEFRPSPGIPTLSDTDTDTPLPARSPGANGRKSSPPGCCGHQTALAHAKARAVPSAFLQLCSFPIHSAQGIRAPAQASA